MSEDANWMEQAEKEMKSAPKTEGKFWKPENGIHRIIIKGMTFRDWEYEEKGARLLKRMADLKIQLVVDGKPADEKTWSIKVSGDERSTYAKVVGKMQKALLEGDATMADGVGLVLTVSGLGIKREYFVQSLQEARKAANALQ